MENRMDEGPSWLKDSLSFNTPSLNGDSVESRLALLHHRTGWNHTLSLYQQAYENKEYYIWNQGSFPFENTFHTQNESVDSISKLLNLDIPRGSLLGNTNPLRTTTFNVTPYIEANISNQGQAVRFNGNPNLCELQSTLGKTSIRLLYLGSPSPFSQVSPICPPQQSILFKVSQSSPEDSGIYHSNVLSDLNKSSNERKNNNNVSEIYCPSRNKGNKQNLFALRTEFNTLKKIIELTSRLQLAAVNSPETESDEPPQIPQSQDEASCYISPLTISPHEASICTWTGQLPAVLHINPTYSCKVFLGGVPWDITEGNLVQTFSKFGKLKIELPGKYMPVQPKGYCYIIFETEKKVKALLNSCIPNFNKGGNWYLKLFLGQMKSKVVQVIPWVITDSYYIQASQKLDLQKTVFVGALHGMITALALAKIMNDLFDGVIYVNLNTDKYNYPIGSARVSFNNDRSYMKAVVTGFVRIETYQFTKMLQINPYLEESLCSLCSFQQGLFFCREMMCFRYYCYDCWILQHSTEAMRSHQYISMNSKICNISPAVRL